MPPSVPSGRIRVRWPRELILGAGAMNMVLGTAAAAPAPAGAAPLRRCPQEPQNAYADPTLLPHFGQITVSGVRPWAAAAGTPSPGVGAGAGTMPGASGSDCTRGLATWGVGSMAWREATPVFR